VDQVLPSSRRGKDLWTLLSIDDGNLIVISGGTWCSRLNALETEWTPVTAAVSNATGATRDQGRRERERERE
jgi:hypothetical protein